MKKYGNEFKVGVFFIICIIGLIYLTFSTGKVDIKREGYNVYVVFNEVAGLEKKAPVMLNGLEVGKVDDINVSYDDDDNETKMVLKLWLNKDAKIRTNPVISIKTLGLMGEKFIQIASTQGKGFVSPGAYLEGKPYTDLDVMMDKAQDIANSVGELTDEVKKLATNLNYTVESNQDKISNIIDNLEATSQNMEELSVDIKNHPWKLLFRTKEKKTK